MGGWGGVSDVSSYWEALETVYDSLLIASPLAFLTTLDGIFLFIPCGSHEDSALRSPLRKGSLPTSQDSLHLWAKFLLFSGSPWPMTDHNCGTRARHCPPAWDSVARIFVLELPRVVEA